MKTQIADKTDDFKALGANIAAARERKGITLDRLSSATGIPLRRLKRLEKDAGSITMGELVKIAMAAEFQYVMEFDDHNAGVLPEPSICAKCEDKCTAARPIAWGEEDSPVYGKVVNAKVPMSCVYYLEHLVSRGGTVDAGRAETA
jgi:transcriptional regulator with XRE-family HTH domain